MAVLFNQSQKDKEDNLNQPPQTNAGAPVSSPTSPSPTTPTPAAPGAAPAGTSSGRFTNLKTYLTANQNFNKPAGGLAGKVAGNITQAGSDVTKNVANAVNTFNQQSGAQVQQAQVGVPLVQQAVADPTAFIQNQQNVKAITDTRDAQYTGPKSLADLSGAQSQASLQGKAQDVATQAGQAQTESGRFNQLRSMFGGKGYTSGQQNLDNLLIQGNQEQLGRLKDTRKVAANVNRDLTQNIGQAQVVGQQAEQNVNTAREQVRGALTQGLTSRDVALAQQAKDARDARKVAIDSAESQLSEGNVSSGLLERMGLGSGTNLYNVNLNDYLKKNNIEATTQNVGSAEDYAKLNALGSLAGTGMSPELSKIIDTYKNTDAGGFQKEGDYSYNKEALAQALAGAKSGYENLIGQATGQQNDALSQLIAKENERNNYAKEARNIRNELSLVDQFNGGARAHRRKVELEERLNAITNQDWLKGQALSSGEWANAAQDASGLDAIHQSQRENFRRYIDAQKRSAAANAQYNPGRTLRTK